jgi:hypothetical protein
MSRPTRRAAIDRRDRGHVADDSVAPHGDCGARVDVGVRGAAVGAAHSEGRSWTPLVASETRGAVAEGPRGGHPITWSMPENVGAAIETRWSGETSSTPSTWPRSAAYIGATARADIVPRKGTSAARTSRRLAKAAVGCTPDGSARSSGDPRSGGGRRGTLGTLSRNPRQQVVWIAEVQLVGDCEWRDDLLAQRGGERAPGRAPHQLAEHEPER